MRVSKSEFLTGGKTSTRNTIISTLFRKVGLAKKAGYGGYRILHVLKKINSEHPTLLTICSKQRYVFRTLTTSKHYLTSETILRKCMNLYIRDCMLLEKKCKNMLNYQNTTQINQ